MYSYIIGDIKKINENYIVLDNNNIGYKILMAGNSISGLSINETYTIYTEHIVREDGIYLYGFLTEEEKDMFNLLNTVSSVGPKASLAILSTLDLVTLKMAIISNDINTISSSPGIGKKTASRIVLELVDKIKVDEDDIIFNKNKANKKSDNNDYKVAVEALVNLGYSKNSAEKALGHVDFEGKKLSAIIKDALKYFS